MSQMEKTDKMSEESVELKPIQISKEAKQALDKLFVVTESEENAGENRAEKATPKLAADESHLSGTSDLFESIRQAFGSPGGKKLLASTIVKLIPEHKIYVEPFAGGAAVFWKKEPSEKEVLNDLDPEIAAAYRILKNYPTEQIQKAVDNFDWTSSKSRWQEYIKGGGADTPNRFSRFLYARKNTFGRGGPHKGFVFNTENKPTVNEQWHGRLKTATILNQRFAEVVKKYDSSNAFIYLDPPYQGKEGEEFHGVKGRDLTLENFANTVKQIKKAKWLVSYADTAEARKIFKEFHIVRVPVRRTFESRPERKKVEIDTELLIANFPFRLPSGTLNRYQEAKKLPKKGEESGEQRLDFMKNNPYIVPGEFKAWRHWRGISEEDVGKSELALFRLGKSASVHIDIRFNWGKDYLEGFTLFTPGNANIGNDKLFGRSGKEKIACTLKSRQPLIWNDKSKLDNRIFEPGEVGNVAGKDTFGKMFLVDSGKFIPTRIRNEKGSRYYEFALSFDKNPKLNGLWAISEGAAKAISEDIGFFFFRLESHEPFHLRHAKEKKYKSEIASLPDWQKPEQAEIDKLLK